MKNTFNKAEVIELIRFYCMNQRILCVLPVCSPKDEHISKEQNKIICKKIEHNADIEKCGYKLENENFEDRLKNIKNKTTWKTHQQAK